MIVATVALCGLTAVPMARRLGVTRSVRTRPLLVGGAPWVIDLADTFRAEGLEMLMWASSEDQRNQIKHAGLEVAVGELFTDAVADGAAVEGVTPVLLLTDPDDFNALAAITLAGLRDTPVYRLAPAHHSQGVAAAGTAGATLFAPALTRPVLTDRFSAGARIFSIPAGPDLPAEADLLFPINPDGTLHPATSSHSPFPQPGETLVLPSAGEIATTR